MRPVRIEGTARPLGAPKNWRDSSGHCGELFIRDENISGVHFMRSAWEPDSDEIGWLLAGAKIQLGISAPQHPVVQVGIGPCPETAEPVYTIRHITSEHGEPGIRMTMYIPPQSEANLGGSAWCELNIGKSSMPDVAANAMKTLQEVAKAKGLI